MIAVLGSFRFPAESLGAARLLMHEVIKATVAEPGCRAYSYAEDVIEPGLFHVSELWDSREALAEHFETPHMRDWAAGRAALGFFDRQLALYELGASEPV